MNKAIPFPIFIVGMPRSGTTLVSNLLNASGEIYIPEETHFYDTLKRFKSKYSIKRNDFDEFKRYYLSDRNFALEYLNLSDKEKKLLLNYDRVHFLEELIKLKMKGSSFMRWGEKTPIHFEFFDQIKEDFPNAKFIHVIRDPRDVIPSIKKANWAKLFPMKLLLNRYKRAAQLSIKYHCNILTVKFEELLGNPEVITKNIYEFCGLTFRKEVLNTFYLKENLNFSTATEPWKENNERPIDKANAFKWKRGTSSFTIKFIGAYLGKEIKLLQYPLSPQPIKITYYANCLIIDIIQVITYLRKGLK